ncbi:MAG: S8 family peptidase [Thermodesulfobacteriota bacterium]
MLRKRYVLLIIIMIMAVSGAALAGSGQNRPAYVPGELIIRFNDSVDQAAVDRALSSVKGKLIKRFARIQALHVRVPEGTVKRAVRILKGLNAVKYAEPNALRYLDNTPNDTQFSSLWGLHNTGQTGGAFDADIDAVEAWNVTTGNPNMVVADIDTGLDMNHPDIAANVYTNPGEIAGNGIDDDGNGYVDDVHGWDFARNDNDPSDDEGLCDGHGTHTAGTIGAVGNNGIGVTGVNWNVKIMPLKVFKVFYGAFCSATSSDIVAAVNYYADMGVRVSNNSYGSTSFTQAEKDAIEASNSVFAAAAGNDNVNTDFSPQYPSAYDLPNIISVAATDHNDSMAWFSNYGLTSVDLGAPGVNILSTLPGNTYASYNGTSMATPHVAGAASLLLAKDPTLTVNEVKWMLLAGVDPAGLTVGTGGRLNINNTFLLPPPVVTMAITPTGPTTVARGGSLSYTVTIDNLDSTTHTVNASVVAVFPDGHEVTLNSKTLNVGALTLVSAPFIKTVPHTIPTGAYKIVGRAEVTGTSYDEDIAPYTITP